MPQSIDKKTHNYLWYLGKECSLIHLAIFYTVTTLHAWKCKNNFHSTRPWMHQAKVKSRPRPQVHIIFNQYNVGSVPDAVLHIPNLEFEASNLDVRELKTCWTISPYSRQQYSCHISLQYCTISDPEILLTQYFGGSTEPCSTLLRCLLRPLNCIIFLDMRLHIT